VYTQFSVQVCSQATAQQTHLLRIATPYDDSFDEMMSGIAVAPLFGRRLIVSVVIPDNHAEGMSRLHGIEVLGRVVSGMTTRADLAKSEQASVRLRWGCNRSM